MAGIDFHNRTVTGLSIGASSLALIDDTTNDVSTAKHGFAPKAPNDATKFLDGTGAYAVPPSSGIGAVLFDATVTGVDAATIDTGAAGIAGGQRGLAIWFYLRTDEAVTLSGIDIRLNADSSAIYDRVFVNTTNATVSGNNSRAQTSWAVSVAGANAAAGVFSAVKMEIPNYAGTVGNKHASYIGGTMDTAAASSNFVAYQLGYRSTTAVTRLAMTTQTGGRKFKVGSRVTILGF